MNKFQTSGVEDLQITGNVTEKGNIEVDMEVKNGFNQKISSDYKEAEEKEPLIPGGETNEHKYGICMGVRRKRENLTPTSEFGKIIQL